MNRQTIMPPIATANGTPCMLGITEYREVHFKPYRVIYRVMKKAVVIYCVLDGRRDMQSLPHRRLLR
jgi:toxin ParE1/3/4